MVLDSSRNNNNNNNEYDYRHIDIVIQKPKNHFCHFYVKDENQQTFTSLKKILKREGKPFSKWVSDLATDYVRLHEPGNPQQRIDTITKIGKAFKAETCQLCDAKPAFYGQQKGMWLGFCHFHWNATKFKTWRKASVK